MGANGKMSQLSLYTLTVICQVIKLLHALYLLVVNSKLQDNLHYHLQQGDYVFGTVCLFVCLFACLFVC